MSIQDEIQQSINSAQKTVSANSVEKLAKEAEEQARQGVKVFENNPATHQSKKTKKVNNTKWKTKTFTSVLPKAAQDLLKTTQDDAKTASKSLETVSQTLNAAKQFVSILEPLEAAITDPIGNLGTQLLKQLEGFFNNAKSTGIYVLNMFEHYYIGQTMHFPKVFQTIESDASTEKSNAIKEFLADDQMTFDYIKNMGLSLDTFNSNEGKQNFINEMKNMKSPAFLFKPTTYEEFIEVVADAFLDPHDLPNGAIAQGKIMYRNPPTKEEDAKKFNDNVKKMADANDITKWDKMSDGLRVNFDKSSFLQLRPGRPQFQEGSHAKVYILMLSLPDLKSYATQMSLFNKLFFTPFGNIEETLGLGNPANQKEKTSDEVTALIDSWHDIFGDANSWSDAVFKNFKFTDAMHLSQSNNLTNHITEGEPPDFYGMSLYSLAPVLFNNINALNNHLKDFTENPGSSFSELINSTIDMVQRKIDKLNRLIKIIDNLIQFFDDLSKINVSILEVSSTKGNYDIYNQIMNSDAASVPNAGTGKSQYMGGFVFAYGAITSSKIDVDYQSYVQDRNMQFDDVKGQLKQLKDEFPGGGAFFEKIIKAFK